MVAFSCAKKPEEKKPDNFERDYFKKEIFSKTIRLKTTAKVKTKGQKPLDLRAVEFVNGPPPLKKLFKDFYIESNKDKEEFIIHFELSNSYLTAFAESDEKEIGQKGTYRRIQKKKKGKTLIPLFYFDISGYGNLEKIKNSVGEETNNFEFKDKTRKDSSYVKITSKSELRILPKLNISFDEKEILLSKLDDFDEKSLYLYLPSTLRAPMFGKTINTFFQGEEKLVKIKFIKEGLQVYQVAPSGYETDQDEFSGPVLTIPGRYIDFSCEKDRFNECTPNYGDNQQISWKDKKYFIPNFSMVRRDEVNTLDIGGYSTPCFLKAPYQYLQHDIKNGVINIRLKQNLKLIKSNQCINRHYSNGTQGMSFDVETFYSIVRLDDLKDPTYKRVNYPNEDKNRFGYFDTSHLVLNEQGEYGRETKITYLSRWSKNKRKGKVFYFLSDSFSKEEEEAKEKQLNVSLKDITIDSIKSINRSLEMAKAGIEIIPCYRGKGKEWLPAVCNDEAREKIGSLGALSGDLRYNTINLIREPLQNGLLGYGPTAVNPLTGEILHGHVNLYEKNTKRQTRSIWNQLAYNSRKGEKGFISKASQPNEERGPGGDRIAIANRASGEIGEEKVDDLEIKNVLNKCHIELLGENKVLNYHICKNEMFLNFAAKKGFYLSSALNVSLTTTKFFKKLKMLPDSDSYFYKDKILKMYEELNGEQKNVISTILLHHAFRSTLIHEVGHNLGLRHNFMGSHDKENYSSKYTEEALKKLGVNEAPKYSSIMDYAGDELSVSAILGPYDIAALKFGYARMIEMKDEKGLYHDKFIGSNGDEEHDSMSAFFKKKNIKNWKKDLKKYEFCTDEHKGDNAFCNPFDHGSSLKEMAQFMIDKYYAFYEYSNFRDDRLHFSLDQNTQYFLGKFYFFNKLRMILGEWQHIVQTNGTVLVWGNGDPMFKFKGCSERTSKKDLYKEDCEELADAIDAVQLIGRFYFDILKEPEHLCSMKKKEEDIFTGIVKGMLDYKSGHRLTNLSPIIKPIEKKFVKLFFDNLLTFPEENTALTTPEEKIEVVKKISKDLLINGKRVQEEIREKLGKWFQTIDEEKIHYIKNYFPNDFNEDQAFKDKAFKIFHLTLVNEAIKGNRRELDSFSNMCKDKKCELKTMTEDNFDRAFDEVITKNTLYQFILNLLLDKEGALEKVDLRPKLSDDLKNKSIIKLKSFFDTLKSEGSKEFDDFKDFRANNLKIYSLSLDELEYDSGMFDSLYRLRKKLNEFKKTNGGLERAGLDKDIRDLGLKFFTKELSLFLRGKGPSHDEEKNHYGDLILNLGSHFKNYFKIQTIAGKYGYEQFNLGDYKSTYALIKKYDRNFGKLYDDLLNGASKESQSVFKEKIGMMTCSRNPGSENESNCRLKSFKSRDLCNGSDVSSKDCFFSKKQFVNMFDEIDVLEDNLKPSYDYLKNHILFFNRNLSLLKEDDTAIKTFQSGFSGSVKKKLKSIFVEKLDKLFVPKTCFNEIVNLKSSEKILKEKGRYVVGFNDLNPEFIDKETNIAVRGIWPDKILSFQALTQEFFLDGRNSVSTKFIDFPNIKENFNEFIDHIILENSLKNDTKIDQSENKEVHPLYYPHRLGFRIPTMNIPYGLRSMLGLWVSGSSVDIYKPMFRFARKMGSHYNDFTTKFSVKRFDRTSLYDDKEFISYNLYNGKKYLADKRRIYSYQMIDFLKKIDFLKSKNEKDIKEEIKKREAIDLLNASEKKIYEKFSDQEKNNLGKLKAYKSVDIMSVKKIKDETLNKNEFPISIEKLIKISDRLEVISKRRHFVEDRITITKNIINQLGNIKINDQYGGELKNNKLHFIQDTWEGNCLSLKENDRPDYCQNVIGIKEWFDNGSKELRMLIDLPEVDEVQFYESYKSDCENLVGPEKLNCDKQEKLNKKFMRFVKNNIKKEDRSNIRKKIKYIDLLKIDKNIFFPITKLIDAEKNNGAVMEDPFSFQKIYPKILTIIENVVKKDDFKGVELKVSDSFRYVEIIKTAYESGNKKIMSAYLRKAIPFKNISVNNFSNRDDLKNAIGALGNPESEKFPTHYAEIYKNKTKNISSEKTILVEKTAKLIDEKFSDSLKEFLEGLPEMDVMTDSKKEEYVEKWDPKDKHNKKYKRNKNFKSVFNAGLNSIKENNDKKNIYFLLKDIILEMIDKGLYGENPVKIQFDFLPAKIKEIAYIELNKFLNNIPNERLKDIHKNIEIIKLPKTKKALEEFLEIHHENELTNSFAAEINHDAFYAYFKLNRAYPFDKVDNEELNKILKSHRDKITPQVGNVKKKWSEKANELITKDIPLSDIKKLKNYINRTKAKNELRKKRKKNFLLEERINQIISTFEIKKQKNLFRSMPLSYVNLPVKAIGYIETSLAIEILKNKSITDLKIASKKKIAEDIFKSLEAYVEFYKYAKEIIADIGTTADEDKKYFIQDFTNGKLESCYSNNADEEKELCIIKLVEVLSKNFKKWNQLRIDIISDFSSKEDMNRDIVLEKFKKDKKCFDFPKNYSKVQESNDFSDLFVFKNHLMTLKECIKTLKKKVVNEGNKQKAVLGAALKEKIDKIYRGPFPKIFKKLYSNSSSIDEIINLTSSLNTDQLSLLEKYRKKKISYNPHEKKSLSSLTTIELKSYLDVLERKTLQRVYDSYKYKLQILPFD
jgi:hypothetical protein